MAATAASTPHPEAGTTHPAAGLDQPLLRTDAAGMPLEWIDFRTAVRLYCLGQVAYGCGTPLFQVRGGWNARNGRRSVVEVHSIVATSGHARHPPGARDGYAPPLSNQTLFARDGGLCLYCGEPYPDRELTRDHVTPLSRGGRDSWGNVVSACRRCNNHKGGRTPEEAGMQLIAVPFTPSYAEYIYLKGRRILADQMEFLLAHIPRSSPLRLRLRRAAGAAC